MKKIILFTFFACILSLQAENIIISGKIVDKDTQKFIPGATIRVVGTDKGTYSSSYGNYKLPIPEGSNKIKVTSFGYFPTELTVNESKENFIIKLTADTISIQGVEVIGEIDADNVIKRAIERKQENLKKLKTSEALLYSKLVFDVDGTGFANSDGNSISLGTSFGGNDDDKEESAYQFFVLETFSKQYTDYENDKSHSEIIQRRQTANIQPDNNLLTITSFRSFYDDELDFMETKIHTPLSKDAFNYYEFELEKRISYGDRYIYQIKVTPDTKIFPAFEGNIKLVEDSYELVEIDLRPSEWTAFPFVESIHFTQRFEEIKNDIWHPMYMEVDGTFNVEAIKGLIEIGAEFSATSIFSEVVINEPLPDSLLKDNEIRSITVSETADSTDISFWEDNSLRKIEDRELEMYQKIDTLIKEEVIQEETERRQVQLNLFEPYLDFNRVGSVTAGLSQSLRYKRFSLETFGAWSFGLQDPIGEARLNINLLNKKLINLNVFGGAFSKLSTNSPWQDWDPLFNTLTSIFGQDYYEYYKQDGWFAGFDVYHQGVRAEFYYETTRHFSEIINTRNVFFSDDFRINPQVAEGEFQTAYADFSFGEIPFVTTGEEFYYELKFKAFATKLSTDDEIYPGLIAHAGISTPIISTGYNPIRFRLDLDAGTASENMPLQYQFKMPTALMFIARSNSFISADISSYGGYEFYSANAELNLTDIWWRGLRLPTYNGRGLDITLNGSTGNYRSDNLFYKDMGNDFYSEIGFGVSRIPTFISNVAFLSLDARWGIGNLAANRFGWSVSVSLPF